VREQKKREGKSFSRSCFLAAHKKTFFFISLSRSEKSFFFSKIASAEVGFLFRQKISNLFSYLSSHTKNLFGYWKAHKTLFTSGSDERERDFSRKVLVTMRTPRIDILAQAKIFHNFQSGGRGGLEHSK
jgi:hypothetical protein